MHRFGKVAVASLTLTGLVALVGASSGAPTAPKPTISPLARPRVQVPNLAPVRPAGIIPRLADAGAKPVPTTSPDAGVTPASTATTTADAGAKPATTADAGAKPATSGPAAPAAPTKAVAVLTAAQKTAIVDKMNALRATLGASSMQTLTWDDNLAAFASTVAGTCALGHSSASDRMSIPGWAGTYVGENLAAANGQTLADATDPVKTSADLDLALTMWWNEKNAYDYATNSCAPAMVCGHYTQVAWAQTRSVGCSVVMCSAASWSWIVACEFGQGGNVSGQKPY